MGWARAGSGFCPPSPSSSLYPADDFGRVGLREGLQGLRPDVPLAPYGQEDLHHRFVVGDLRNGNEIVLAMLLYGYGG